jgi:hypothetical protein
VDLLAASSVSLIWSGNVSYGRRRDGAAPSFDFDGIMIKFRV